MPFKINIGTEIGKTYKIELETKSLEEKEIGSTINGIEISPELEGYEFKITGASDNAGFPALKEIEGIGLKKILLTYGKAMKKHPKKEGKKKRSNPKPKGLRLRKTVRGKIISKAISQINLKTIKKGKKPLSEIFKEQEKSSEQSSQEQEKKQ